MQEAGTARKRRGRMLLLVFGLGFFPLLADEVPLLVPKRLRGGENPELQSHPSAPQWQETERSSGTRLRPSLSALVSTPVLGNTIDSAFFSYGPTFLGSVPLAYLSGLQSTLSGEGGVEAMFSQRMLVANGISYLHAFLIFPLQLRLTWELSEALGLGIFAGVRAKLFEWDSRPTLDGGFFFTTNSSLFEPNGGVNLTYHFATDWSARLLVGVWSAGVGVDWRL